MPAKRSARPPTSPYGRGTGVAHPIDVEVGKRIRQRRLLLNMNQETLADRLGLTFQQVQKYEHGANRVSASRLAAVADTLGVSIGYFFRDIDAEGTPVTAEEQRSRDLLHQSETIELVRLYYEIPDEEVRQTFLQLVKAIRLMYAQTGRRAIGAARAR